MAAVETQAPTDPFQKVLGKSLLTASSAEEDLSAATSVFNGAIPKRRPQEIVVATGTADIIAAVKYASVKGLKVGMTRRALKKVLFQGESRKSDVVSEELS
jgi:hypothetical protein